MVLNKQKGNMYGFVTHTWNPIKGKCSHDCRYCYMKVWKQKSLRLVTKELGDELGENNFIFVGSSTDMFADDVPKEWIEKVIDYCHCFPKNRYLFQTKNPKGFIKWKFPENSIFGITLETNRDYELANTPYRLNRVKDFIEIKKVKKFVTIEPILDFDYIPFIYWLQNIQPEFIAIGADSKGHKMLEPSKEKVEFLIKELSKFTKVIKKDNLKRLIEVTVAIPPITKVKGILATRL